MYEAECKAAVKAAKEAQKLILEIYNTPFDVEIKSDKSPVTKADKKADEYIRGVLGKLFPEIGFLTEESKDTGERLSKKAIWIVDPVDGTTEFVSRNGQFTTNIALAIDGEVVVGVTNVPTLDVCYYAIKGQGAYRINADGSEEKIHVSDSLDHLIALRSLSHLNQKEIDFMEAHKDRLALPAIPKGAALKFCLIAEGTADFFYRNGEGTKEWDVASGDLLVREAGGIVLQGNGEPFHYNKADVMNHYGYIVVNREENLFRD